MSGEAGGPLEGSGPQGGAWIGAALYELRSWLAEECTARRSRFATTESWVARPRSFGNATCMSLWMNLECWCRRVLSSPGGAALAHIDLALGFDFAGQRPGTRCADRRGYLLIEPRESQAIFVIPRPSRSHRSGWSNASKKWARTELGTGFLLGRNGRAPGRRHQ